MTQEALFKDGENGVEVLQTGGTSMQRANSFCERVEYLVPSREIAMLVASISGQ